MSSPIPTPHPAMPMIHVGRIAHTNSDPIFALIQAHKDAIIAQQVACSAYSDAEESVPRHARKSDSMCGELTLDQSDDPRWIEAVTNWHFATERADEIAAELVSADISTFEGISALLRYAVEHEDAGHLWPDRLFDDHVDDEECRQKVRPWTYFLQRHTADALSKLIRH